MHIPRALLVFLAVCTLVAAVILVTFGALYATRGSFKKPDSNNDLDATLLALTSSPSPTANPTVAPSLLAYGLQPDCFENDETKYNICLDVRSRSGKYEPWMDSFAGAKERWEEVVVGDNLPPTVFDAWETAGSNSTMNLTIDDLIILAYDLEGDGRGGVLGAAAPAVGDMIGAYNIPRGGWMAFDEADIDFMMFKGTWNDTILHEMGHVLGIGTAWKKNGLHSAEDGDDEYHGLNAQEQWERLGCVTGRVPVETDGGPGNAKAHFDNKCLRAELMTGSASRGMKLSTITIGALADIGYIVDYSAADDFTLKDLGVCGNYCPEQKRPKNNTVLGGSNRRLADDAEKPTLGTEAWNQVLQMAAEMFLSIHSIFAETMFGQRGDTFSNEVIVYYEHQDGSIYDYPVSFEEVQDYIGD